MCFSAAIHIKDEDGNTHISIDHIIEIADQRPSLGGSLKLYFFKIYLKQDNLNQLRWIEYKADGSFAYQKTMVAWSQGLQPRSTI
jgi:hypothetical protein